MLLNRNDKHAFLADKFKVRDYVKGKGLADILTHLFGVWDDANKINFDLLPDKFALKCNHGCGMNIICDDRSQLDIKMAISTLNKWMFETHDIYYESHYKKIKPVIICEEFISDNSGLFPMDYKIHCAHGKPVFIQVCIERSKNAGGVNCVYDLDWNDLHFAIDDKGHSVELNISKPKNLDKMLNYASILSSDLNYARIDFYDVGDRVFFGEITLTPMGGWLTHFTKEAQIYMGTKIRNNEY